MKGSAGELERARARNEFLRAWFVDQDRTKIQRTAKKCERVGYKLDDLARWAGVSRDELVRKGVVA